MAKKELTGWSPAEKEQAKRDWLGGDSDRTEDDWERVKCLAKINYQPEDYEGPQRICSKWTLTSDDPDSNERSALCDTHGGWMSTEPGLKEADGFDEQNGAAITHGMYAEDANLKENFSEADEKLFDLVMSFGEKHGWEEGDPEFLLLEDFALSKVRAMRAEKYLNDNGEIVERKEFIEALGDFEVHEEVHPLKGDLRLQKKTILDMMKELGLTPKSKSQMDSSETEASAMDQIADVATKAVDGDHEYDPQEF